MEISVRYFAGVRELVGTDAETIDVGSTGGELTVADCSRAIAQRHPDLEGVLDDVRVAVDREFVGPTARVESGDEVALIPPVSGGSGEEVEQRGRFEVTAEPLDAGAVRRRVERPEAGAVVVFRGVVRNHTGDREVRALEYESYEAMAVEQFRRLTRRIASEVGDVEASIHHRTGRLTVGDVAVVVAVSSPHRPEAFEATRRLIDELKEDAPIWKKEIGPEGEEWIGWECC